MTMHTHSYNDADGRRLVKKHLVNAGYLVYDPPYNTSKVGDLFCVDPDTADWFIVEVEQMGADSVEYIKKMINFATGKWEPWEDWKKGFSIVPRKFEYFKQDHEISDRLKQECNLQHVTEPLKWQIFLRISPDQSGMFMAYRKDVSGFIEGDVNTERHKMKERRKTVPWNKVEYIELS